MHRVAFRIDGILIVNIETKSDTRTDGIDQAVKWRYRYHSSLGGLPSRSPSFDDYGAQRERIHALLTPIFGSGTLQSARPASRC